MPARAPRVTHSSGSPFEASIGFSRAIRVGNRILVSGTAPIEPNCSSTAGAVLLRPEWRVEIEAEAEVDDAG